MDGELERSHESWRLKGVEETGEVIGKGAFGTVYKVKKWGTIFAAKKLHGLQLAGSNSRAVLAKFERECRLISSLHHPHLVQFLGAYVDTASGSPVLVMEHLSTSLAACIERRPPIPKSLQISLLRNVALGLAYLHDHAPPIIHCNLTANNVLLTSNMEAKVADLGVVKILALISKNAPLKQAPGTAAYMPPEALSHVPSFSTKTDSFSFGVLVVHLVTRQLPIPAAATKDKSGKPASEALRRQRQLDLMERDHCLLPLVLQCLQNVPELRPEAPGLVDTLGALQARFPLPTTAYIDLLQVLEDNRNQLETKGVQLVANKEQLQLMGLQLEGRGQEVTALKQRVAGLERMVAGSLKGLMLQGQDAETNRPNATTSLQPTQSAFVWKRDADMPVGVYGARAVILEDKLYIGGGDQMELSADRVVYEYDVNGLVRKWTALPPSPVAYFALAEVNKSLTLVGGWDCSRKAHTGQLTVWDREQQRWSVPFPAMPTPRQDSTASTHQLWLLVAGGVNFKKPVYNVELFDCATVQWHTIRPLPKPSVGMTSCVIRNTWYLLGGTNFTNPAQGECGPQESVFSLCLDENIASNRWNILPDSPLFCSTAVAFGDYLLSVGGTDSPGSQSCSPALFLFSPTLEKWLFIGNLPTARSHTTCAMLSKGRLAVLGGQEKGTRNGKTVEILYC